MNPQKRDLTTWDCVVAKKTAASCTLKEDYACSYKWRANNFENGRDKAIVQT